MMTPLEIVVFVAGLLMCAAVLSFTIYSLMLRLIDSTRRLRKVTRDSHLLETCEGLQIRTSAMGKWIINQGGYIRKLEAVVDDKVWIAENKPQEAADEFIEELRKADFTASGS